MTNNTTSPSEPCVLYGDERVTVIAADQSVTHFSYAEAEHLWRRGFSHKSGGMAELFSVEADSPPPEAH